MARQGRFIAIEGTDGSGKGTQAKLLVAALRRRGQRVHLISFPQYGKPSAAPIEAFLNGDFGTGLEVGPYRASLFYAIDRIAARRQILSWLQAGDTVIADRYTASNLAHQGWKVTNPVLRRHFWKWLETLEHVTLGLPRPDRTVVLLVPPTTARQLVLKKKRRSYIRYQRSQDMVERDRVYQQKSYDVYRELCRRDRRFRLIDCAPKGKLLSKRGVHDRIVAALARLW